jgi:hypothetical protein
MQGKGDKDRNRPHVPLNGVTNTLIKTAGKITKIQFESVG